MNIKNMEDINSAIYYFYQASDPKKEKIAKMRSESLEWAEETFATLKGLNIDDFRKLYRVEEWTPVSKG
jgi:hypothetical protein